MHDLESLRKEAKFWLKQVRDNHSGFTKRLRLAYPGAPANPTLRDIQHALAREQGYESWKALQDDRRDRADVEVGPYRHDDGHEGADYVSRFLGFACWDHLVHGRGDYRANEAAAMRLLEKHPEIPAANIYSAVVCGDVAEVSRFLDRQPGPAEAGRHDRRTGPAEARRHDPPTGPAEAGHHDQRVGPAEAGRHEPIADAKGGVHNWEPLLYLCYARLPLPALRDNAVAIAQLLLDRGANPNAYYMAGHSVYGALVGVAGEGEQDAPVHPARDTLYRLLLERGAEPYDIQVLYNTHFRGNVMWWLTLTWEYSVAAGRQGDWADPELSIFDMGGYGSGARFLLWLAIQKGNRELAEWLLVRGANPNAGPPRATTLPQMSLLRYAQLEGHDDIAQLLLRHGAVPEKATEDEDVVFVQACIRGDRDAAAAMVPEQPRFVRTPHLLVEAAKRNRPDVLSLLLDLGTPVNVQDRNGRTALHEAAASNSREAAALLLERGADANIRESHYQATPLGFASHHDHRAMIDLLTPYSRDAWALAGQGKVARLREVLAAEPQRAGGVDGQGRTILWYLPDDEEIALEVMELLLAAGADPSAKAKDGTTAADSARALGLDRVVERLGRAWQ